MSTLAELQVLEAELDAKKQFLEEKEGTLNALAVQLSQVPAKVKELTLREATILAREQAIRPQEQAVSDDKAALASRTKGIDLTEASQRSAGEQIEFELSRLAALELRLKAQEDQQVARASELDDKDRVLYGHATLNSANANSLKALQEAFNAERVVRVRDEEARLSEISRLLDKRAAELEAQAAEYVISPLKLAEQQEALNARMDVYSKLEANLATHQTTLDEKEQALAQREASCSALEAKQAAWKEGMELTDLRLQKREREVRQLIEKHNLQAELTPPNG